MTSNTCAIDIAEEFIGQISPLSAEEQNEVIETLVRKFISVRDKQLESMNHKAMLLRNSQHEFRNRMLHLNQRNL